MKKKSKIDNKKSRDQYNLLVGKSFRGELEVSNGGRGFVVIEGKERDVMVYPEDLHVAMHGDFVSVRIKKVTSGGRLIGEVTNIITHARTEFVGTMQVSKNFGFLVPDKENTNTDIFIPADKLNGAKDGDKAVVKITDWQANAKNPIGEVVEILSGLKDNQIAMKEILVFHGFPLQFSKEALTEAVKLPQSIQAEELKKRKDLRSLLTFTIDPADAKDFDDALSFRLLDNGNYELGVHIADVSYYVRQRTKLDDEAYERATSVYLPGMVLPMLPEQISNVLCSLRPNEEKYAFSVIFQVNTKGTIRHFWMGKTVIRSDRRFVYDEVQQIIETGQGDYAQEILTLNEIAQNLRRKRFSKGAINFSSEEIQFELDEQGVPVGLKIKVSKEANQLIEEFMLLANKKVAEYISAKQQERKPIPFPYRIHDLPDEAKLATFATFASRFGYRFNLVKPESIANTFNEMLLQAEGKPEKQLLEQLGIRTMAKAAYSTENIGHFGLGFKDYCHFTSPIRRYPDIIVHRILEEVLEKEFQPDKKMESKCQHCSIRERKAMEAERESDKYKQVEYMQKFVGETLDAVITGVSSMGFWAETIEQRCEGMVSMSDLQELDQFEYLEREFCLRGKNTGLSFRMGDPVKVLIVAVNLERRRIDMALIDEFLHGRQAKKISQKKKKNNRNL